VSPTEIELPTVTLKWAQSVDGQLADDDDCSQWISGAQERKYTHFLRSAHDAVLVGAQTFLKDQCKLTVREAPCPHEQPSRIIADPRARLLDELRSGRNPFSNDPTLSLRTTFILSPELPDDSVNPALEGVVWTSVPPGQSLEGWIKGALQALTKSYRVQKGRPLRRLMVEGGPMILTAFLRAGLADRAEVAVSPLLLGGKRNRIFTDSRLNLNADQKLVYESFEKLGDDILLKYHVRNNCNDHKT
jgi:diaminohydroxyphosphoribosylaminopyrimidine deaminase/5-amino-6-(5-phosphoribosylamino)uracil reductase